MQDDSTWVANYSGVLSLYEHDYTLPTADASKTLDSIQIETAGNEVVFGISGDPSAVPEPSAVILLLTVLAMVGVLIRRKIAAN